jgi:hypothetical protein
VQLLPEKFWAKVKKGDGCWEWQGRTDKKGYGYLTVKKSRFNAETLSAHRLAWELTYGKIGNPALVVRHYECDNRICCRPSHLRLGTHQDNMDDMVKAGRSLSGARATSAKLSPAAVAIVRRLALQGCSASEIARRFGVHQTTISRILSKKTWR